MINPFFPYFLFFFFSSFSASETFLDNILILIKAKLKLDRCSTYLDRKIYIPWFSGTFPEAIGVFVMEFHIVIYYDEETKLYWGKVLELEGVYSQGESIESLLKNIREAIELHLEALSEEDFAEMENIVKVCKVEVKIPKNIKDLKAVRLSSP